MKSGPNPRLDYVLVNLLGGGGTPSLERAEEYGNARSTKSNHNGEKKWWVEVEQYRKYGTGVYLYFKLLLMLSCVFLLMALASLPAVLSNLKGNGLDIYGDPSLIKTLMKLSLANQFYADLPHLDNHSATMNIEVNHAIVICCDVMASIIFFAFLVLWKIKSEEAVEQMVEHHALPSYYCLEVRKLPACYSEESIVEHFQKFGGEVTQVSTVYGWQNTLNELKQFLWLMEEYNTSRDELKKQTLYSQMQQQLQSILQERRSEGPHPVLCIITYDDMELKQKVRDLYKYKVSEEMLKYENTEIDVRSCYTEPSQILWENFHLRTLTTIKHACCAFTILFVVLVVAFVALFLANAHATSMFDEQETFKKQIDYDQDYTYEEVVENNTLPVIYNFCSKLTYKTFQLRYYHICQPYFDNYKHRIQVMVVLSLLVVGINVFLSWIIDELAQYRRYKTTTERSRFIILNTFVLYFVNSGLLMLLVRVQLGGFSFGAFLSKVVPLSLDSYNIEPYDDFNRKWYLSVGSQLILIYAMSLLLAPFLQILLSWCQRRLKLWLAKRASTQHEMNQLLLHSQFDFQTFYALTLNCIFFTMFYANALPILYVLAFVACVLLYFTSTIVFFYFSSHPPILDHGLNYVIAKIMCGALVVHQLMSILYFWVDDVFPGVGANDLGHKLRHGAGYLVLAVLFGMFGYNYGRICRALRKVYNKCIGKKQHVGSGSKMFREVFGDGSNFLSSYRLEDNPNYTNLSYTINILHLFRHYPSHPDSSLSFSPPPVDTNRPLKP